MPVIAQEDLPERCRATECKQLKKVTAGRPREGTFDIVKCPISQSDVHSGERLFDISFQNETFDSVKSQSGWAWPRMISNSCKAYASAHSYT